MNFSVTNSSIYEYISTVSNIPIYNAIKLNSTDIGNLTEAQEGDILTYDGEKWIYSSPIDSLDSILFLTNVTITTGHILKYPESSVLTFNNIELLKGTNISLINGQIIINTGGTYEINMDMQYNNEGPTILQVVTGLRSQNVGDFPSSFVITNSGFDGPSYPSHISYIKTFLSGDILIPFAYYGNGDNDFIFPIPTGTNRIIIKRIS
jgi:hypothetical protein